MDDLIVSALEEGRVDRADGMVARGGHTRCKENGVFFGDTDIEELVGQLFLKNIQPSTGGHGSGDAHDVFVLTC